MEAGKGITYQEFMNHLEGQLLIGQNYRSIPKLSQIYER